MCAAVYTAFMIALPEQFERVSLTALPLHERPGLLRALTEGEAARGLRPRPGVPLSAVAEALPGTYGRIPWARDGYYIDTASRAGSHALHAAGAYYLQEPSAMAPAGLLDIKPGQRVLDLCAAPGGKSTQIGALLAGEGVLVANEIVPARARVLSHNIERMGIVNAIAVNEPPERLASRWGAWFDRVLVDAPCSGEGMFRREAEAISEWTPESPKGCAARQMKILVSAAKLLRPGGMLVYSTCTFNEIENEGVVASFLREHPAFALEETVRLWPHRARCEGQFAARLVKEGSPRALEACGDTVRLGGFLPAWDGMEVRGRYARQGERHWSMPCVSPPLEGIRMLRTGLGLAWQRGKVCVPDHALALAFPPGEWPQSVAVDAEGAARYLRGETMEACGAPDGWTVIAYRGLALGWAKSVDGVLKNHLPKGLRRLTGLPRMV